MEANTFLILSCSAILRKGLMAFIESDCLENGSGKVGIGWVWDNRSQNNSD